MTNLYFASVESGVGTTALAAACRSHLADRGRDARYYKPIGLTTEGRPDTDAAFCRDVFGENGVVGAEHMMTAREASAAGPEALTRLKNVARSAGGVTLCIDGGSIGDSDPGTASEQANALAATVIGVVRYQRGMDPTSVLALRTAFGDAFRGAVLNAVPLLSQRMAREETVPALARAGVRVLGILPEDKLLLGFSVSQYCDRLGGRILNSEDRSDEIVERLLVGANALDPGEEYYGRVANKALITRGDRPDLQFSALDMQTRCLILTHGVEPIPYVLDHAVEQGVPIMLVSGSTLDAITAIEAFVTEPAFHHTAKLARMAEMVAVYMEDDVMLQDASVGAGAGGPGGRGGAQV